MERKKLALDLARTNFNYSTENIPVHRKDLYIKTLISKSETFLKKYKMESTFLFQTISMDRSERNIWLNIN